MKNSSEKKTTLLCLVIQAGSLVVAQVLDVTGEQYNVSRPILMKLESDTNAHKIIYFFHEAED